MKFPMEQAVLVALFIVAVLGLSTCNVPQQKCSIVHENVPHLQKCEAW